jgi:TRAP-type C4-dicarboxylate transport system permease small subunit
MDRLAPTAYAGERSGFLATWSSALERLASGFALVGGAILVLLVAMSIMSIVGRKLFNAPIQGDIELMEMGMAIGAATFLPYCEIHDRHIKVDAITHWLPERVRAVLDSLAHAALGAMAGVLVWRTTLRCLSVYATGDVSALLSVPIWVPMALLLPSLLLLCLAAMIRAACAAALVVGSGN